MDLGHCAACRRQARSPISASKSCPRSSGAGPCGRTQGRACNASSIPIADLRQAAAGPWNVSGNGRCTPEARRGIVRTQPQYAEAAAVYQGGLKGIFEHDPIAASGFGRGALFASGRIWIGGERRSSSSGCTNPGIQIRRTDIFSMRASSRRKMHSRRLKHEYAAMGPGIPGLPKPRSGTHCCSSGGGQA